MPIEIICSNDDNTEVVREDELTSDTGNDYLNKVYNKF